ncbi:MAG: formyltetrahydrofolate deformylase, partial [Caulobacteraceae bacterium]|nr:formyltetrahydrofolate deformylase [Caulobacteraceae bacterium]
MSEVYILHLQCPDRFGLVAQVASFLAERGCNIVDAQQYNDRLTDRFFMRVAFEPSRPGSLENLRGEFQPLAQAARMDWTLEDRARPRKVLLMVSKWDHCLGDLLYRNRV